MNANVFLADLCPSVGGGTRFLFHVASARRTKPRNPSFGRRSAGPFGLAIWCVLWKRQGYTTRLGARMSVRCPVLQ